MRNEELRESTERNCVEEAREKIADIVEEIEVEDLTVDGICGVY